MPARGTKAALAAVLAFGVPVHTARVHVHVESNGSVATEGPEDTFDHDDERQFEHEPIEYSEDITMQIEDMELEGAFDMNMNVSSASDDDVSIASAVCSDRTSGKRVVSMGDQHGDFDGMLSHLKKLGLVKSSATSSSSTWSNLWRGGTATFIQTGDVLDRGPDGKKMYKFLWALQDNAASNGGRVILLIGNHELMVLQGDIRYVTNQDFCAYTKDNCGGRPPSTAAYCSTCCNYDNGMCSSSPSKCMKGNCDFLKSWDKGGEMGAELRRRMSKGLMKMAHRESGVVFTHAGLVSSLWNKIGGSSISRLNDRAAKLFADYDGKALWRTSNIVAASSSSNGPTWTRVCYDDWYTATSRRRSSGKWEYMSDSEHSRVSSSRCRSITDSLSAISGKKMVIGHCPQGPSSGSNGVKTKCSGDFILADTYMSKAYAGSRSKATYNQAALEYYSNSADRIFAVYSGRGKCVRL